MSAAWRADQPSADDVSLRWRHTAADVADDVDSLCSRRIMEPHDERVRNETNSWSVISIYVNAKNQLLIHHASLPKPLMCCMDHRANIWMDFMCYIFRARQNSLLRRTQYGTSYDIFRLSVWPYITRWYCVKTTRATIISSSREITPWLTVSSRLTAPQHSKGNIESRSAEMREGYEKLTIFSQQVAVSQKRWNIGPRLLWRSNRKSHMRFRLVPKPSTFDDLERPKRTLWQKRCVLWSPLQKFKWS